MPGIQATPQSSRTWYKRPCKQYSPLGLLFLHSFSHHDHWQLDPWTGSSLHCLARTRTIIILSTSRGPNLTPSHSNDRPSTTKLRPSSALPFIYLIIDPSLRFLKHLALASASERCFGLEALQVHISPSRSVRRLFGRPSAQSTTGTRRQK